MCSDPVERKIRLEHKYQIRRLWLDKILLGFLVGLFALLASMFVEDFKGSLNRDKFLLESRLTALREIRDEYSELGSDYYYLAKAEDAEKEVIRERYKTKLDRFMATLNKWSILFSERFNDQVQFHYWIHQAPAHNEHNLTDEHIRFGSRVFDDFDKLTRIALWEETLGQTPSETALIKFEDDDDVGDFFEANYLAWRREREKYNNTPNPTQ